MSVAIEVPLAKNSTWEIVAPALAVALAVTVVAVPTVVDAPDVGAVMATVGTGAAAVTFTAAEVAVMLAESVTRAVSATAPALVGVHETE